MNVDLIEAKERLDELVARANAGETVRLVRDGETVAEITPIPPKRPRKPFPLEQLQALTASMPLQNASAGEFVRQLRDEDRY